MSKRLSVLLALMVVGFAVHAHEFWMQPDKFFFAPGERMMLTFKVGENFTGESWDLKRHRVEKLDLHSGQQVTSMKTGLKDGDKENASILLQQEGTHMLVMQSNNAFSKLDGEKFNEYLKEDGLDDAYYEREKTNTLTDSASELYSRHAKLLVQVGDKTNDTYKKVLNLPIEIVPDQNPYALKVGDPIRFKILANGKPVFGARVKVWNRYDNRTTMQNIYSQKDGMIDARITSPGPWMVSVVRMEKSKNPKAQWQSYWGSFVFGVK